MDTKVTRHDGVWVFLAESGVVCVCGCYFFQHLHDFKAFTENFRFEPDVINTKMEN